LVGFSTAQPSLFKRNTLEPISDLKLLIKDYTPIARNALTMLINVSDDPEVVKTCIDDDVFLESLLKKVTVRPTQHRTIRHPTPQTNPLTPFPKDPKDANCNLHCMLLANLGKSPDITKLLRLKREPLKGLSTSPIAIDQLLDCFVKGAEGAYNPKADYDYLSYLFADLAKHEDGRAHFLAPRKEDGDVVPLTKMLVFTEHKSTIRRRGVANTIKNCAFDTPAHPKLLAADEDQGANLLPYLLLPLMGSEEYSDEDNEGMLDECQLLDPDKQREPQEDIIVTHLETLLLLCTTREARERFREIKLYPILREVHSHVENDDVRENVDRVVQTIMRGEEGDGERDDEKKMKEIAAGNPEDEDEQIVEVA
jgi:hypothetical protein